MKLYVDTRTLLFGDGPEFARLFGVSHGKPLSNDLFFLSDQSKERNCWSTRACFSDSVRLQDLLASGTQVGIPIVIRMKLGQCPN